MQLKIKDFHFHQEEWNKPITSGSRFFFSTVETGRQDYYCLNSSQQFDLLIEIILFNHQRGYKSLVVFPTKRIMALYYHFLIDYLQDYGINCTRLDRGKKGLPPGEKIAIKNTDVFLTPPETVFQQASFRGLFEYPGLQIVILEFPGLGAQESVPSEFIGLPFSLSFQRINPPANFDFNKVSLDSRNKLDYLQELAEKNNKPLFIYANQIQRVLELYHGLKKMMPGRQPRIWYTHSGFCSSQRQHVLNAINHQLAEIIVTNELLDLRISPEIGETQRLIFDLPLSLEEFYLKSRPGLYPLSVHLLWNKEDLRENENVLKMIFPEKKAMMPLLKKIDEMVCSEGKKLDRQQVIRALKVSFPHFPRPALKHALRVWKEMEGGGLESSGEFLQGEREKNSFSSLKSLLNQEDDRVTDFLLEGVETGE
ncbi:MAG TPA: hypothetical protein GX711_09460 [Clostridia bacterium]|nr:hypothetical protein [Clostridia bacterium]